LRYATAVDQNETGAISSSLTDFRVGSAEQLTQQCRRWSVTPEEGLRHRQAAQPRKISYGGRIQSQLGKQWLQCHFPAASCQWPRCQPELQPRATNSTNGAGPSDAGIAFLDFGAVGNDSATTYTIIAAIDRISASAGNMPRLCQTPVYRGLTACALRQRGVCLANAQRRPNSRSISARSSVT